MSIIIRDMKMPEDCPVCPLAHWNKLDRFTGCEIKKRYFDKTDMETRGRPSFCPLVELPAEHGRLIDADALMKIIKAHDYPLRAHFNSTDNGMFTIGIQQAVDETPTIIEAEEASE